MKYIKKLIVATFIFMSLFIFSGCNKGERSLSVVKRAGELVVATNAEFPPFEYKEGTKIVGLEVDIIKGYCDYIGVKCKFQDQDFDATFLSVYSHKADLGMSGYTVTELRKKRYSFSDTVYNSGQVVIVREGSKYASINDKDVILEELSKDKAQIGVQRGTTGEYYVSGDESWGFDGIHGTKAISYDNVAMAATDLSNGSIDAVIIDEAPGEIAVKKISGLLKLDIILTEEEYAFLFTKNNNTLRESVNEYLALIKSNGEMDKIIAKYF